MRPSWDFFFILFFLSEGYMSVLLIFKIKGVLKPDFFHRILES